MLIEPSELFVMRSVCRTKSNYRLSLMYATKNIDNKQRTDDFSYWSKDVHPFLTKDKNEK